jgi:hypothetical protein
MKAQRIANLAATAALALVSGSTIAAPAENHGQAGEEVISDVLSLGVPAPRPASPRGPEAEGPFARLVIRNVHLIDGTGAPSKGLVNIEIARDRIVLISDVGGTRTVSDKGGAVEPGTRVIDGKGGYVLPGFVNTHEHLGTPIHVYGGQLTDTDYVLKLLLAHGVTTVRDVGSIMGLGWTVRLQQQSGEGTITAPRIVPYALFPEPTATPEAARAWVQAARRNGAMGVKFLGAKPDVFRAAIAEIKKLGMGSAYHHSQVYVTRQNAVDSAALGLDSIEHWYGLPEAMFADKTVQAYPSDYNYNDEQDRFAQAGRLWRQTAAPGSDIWNATIKKLVDSHVTLNPTFNIYEVARDLPRAQRLGLPTPALMALSSSIGQARTRAPGGTTSASGCAL